MSATLDDGFAHHNNEDPAWTYTFCRNDRSLPCCQLGSACWRSFTHAQGLRIWLDNVHLPSGRGHAAKIFEQRIPATSAGSPMDGTKFDRAKVCTVVLIPLLLLRASAVQIPLQIRLCSFPVNLLCKNSLHSLRFTYSTETSHQGLTIRLDWFLRCCRSIALPLCGANSVLGY